MVQYSGELLCDALVLAATMHRNQKDKQGAPYLHHLLNVAQTVRPLGLKYEIVALLHDAIEDTEATIEAIFEYFGPEVAKSISAMTKNEEEDYFTEYLPRLCSDEIARYVKFADSQDNLDKSRNLPDINMREKYNKKYSSVLAYIRPRLEAGKLLIIEAI